MRGQQITFEGWKYWMKHKKIKIPVNFFICSFLFLTFELISPAYLQAQEIELRDVSSLQPIVSAYIYSKEKAVLTNERGKASLSGFNEEDTLFIQHISYHSKKITFQALKSQKFKCFLSEKAVDLDEIIISLNRWEQKKRDIPNKIALINKRTISLFQAQTTADLLGASDLVFIQKSQLGGGSPMIRGFAANRVLLVVDGIRMNNAIFRSGNLQNVIAIDPNLVEHAEVIFGPGSVLYGSDAIGGVMNFQTMEPVLSSNNKTLVKANALSRYSTANQEKSIHGDISIGGKQWAWLGSFSFSDFNDLRMGEDGRPEYLRKWYVTSDKGKDRRIINDDPLIQKFSGYQQHHFSQKLRYKANEDLSFLLGFHHGNTSDVPRYDRLLEERNGLPRSAEWYYGPQSWTMEYFQGSILKANPLFDKLKFSLALQQYKESRNDRAFGSSSLRSRKEGVDIFSFNLDGDKIINEKYQLNYGFEALLNTVDSKGSSLDLSTNIPVDIASRYPDGSSWKSYAAYISAKSRFHPKWILSGGIRYNYILLSANLNTPFFRFPFSEADIKNSSFSGSLGTVFQPSEDFQVNMNVSTGFRAPNIDDVGKVFDSEPGNVIVPNPDLKAEYAYNADLGLIQTLGEHMQIEASLFYTWLENAMDRRNFSIEGKDSIYYDGMLSQVQALVNVDEASVYGCQLSLSAELSSFLTLTSSFTWMDGKTADHEAIRHISPLFGSTHFILRTHRMKTDLYASYNGKVSYEKLAISERNKPQIYAIDHLGRPFSPAWYTLNLKSSFQIHPLIQLNAGIENILDQRYRPYSSGIVAAGRNFIIALRGSI